ncbi:MAG TPA: nuclear transport factor 2 family protein, partial [Pyrinomonadaceae bacterium]|nr:nuclear transport factor 2 family protein [Pyrinomonadaceae bacterium]
YNKISDSARWDIYGESRVARRDDADADAPARDPAPEARRARGESGEAEELRGALRRWVEATNARDVEGQMSFYAPTLEAFYLSRNAARSAVRAEKSRAFASARLVDIRAEEPEIIFREAGRVAIMRFRKRYRVDTGARSRRGEVIQELRWRRAPGGWRIFSERDIRVLR